MTRTCSAPNKRATHLGIFQGLSIGLGLTVGFPIGGILGAKYMGRAFQCSLGPRSAKTPELVRGGPRALDARP